MKITPAQIGKILLKGSYISQTDFDMATSEAKKRRVDLIQYLLSANIINKNLLGQAMAEHFDLPYADLGKNIPAPEQVLKIPEKIAKKYNIALFSETDKQITISTCDPENKEIIQALKKIFKEKKIQLAYSVQEDIQGVFTNYRTTLDTRFGKIIKSQNQIAPTIIDEILKDALSFNASDIHFEPQEKEALIRFRVDGILEEAGRIDKSYYANIVNRIKILALLRIDEHSVTQDGALRFNESWGKIDLRVSIVPTVYGEKVVLRILSQHVGILSLDSIGFSAHDQAIITKSVHRPFGMILAVGPTGSGKTVTIYSLINLINNSRINITSIEDPVECVIHGANQIQVTKHIPFARGLRSIVRQDPDVILVGEIRDRETAEIAVNAALSGHLLFSTFHANNTSTVVSRLIDMGVEPFILASTLELIISQRLARRICVSCRYSSTISKDEFQKISANKKLLKQFGFTKNTMLYRGKGCPACNHTGYKGRVALFEILPASPAIRQKILENPSAEEIWAEARKEGVRSLFEDGLEKIKLGLTTFEELFRVAAID